MTVRIYDQFTFVVTLATFLLVLGCFVKPIAAALEEDDDSVVIEGEFN